MKLLKLYAWEESFRKAVEVVRQSELKVLLKLTLLRGMICKHFGRRVLLVAVV